MVSFNRAGRESGIIDAPVSFLPEHLTSRADLAACMLAQAASPQFRHKTLAVATVAVKPKMVKLILKEAFGISLGGPRTQTVR